MSLEIVDAEQVLTGRRGRSRGEKYVKYAESLKKHVDWLKDNIKDSDDGFIRLKVKDLAKEMGQEYTDKDERTLYTAIRYVLFGDGIYVELGTHKDGDKLLIMRMTTKEDKLPGYLEREGMHLEAEEKQEPVELPEEKNVEMEESSEELESEKTVEMEESELSEEQ